MVLPIAMLVACAGCLAAALALSRWSFYCQEDADEPVLIFVSDQTNPHEAEARSDDLERGLMPMTLPVPFAPYLFLGIVAVAVLTIVPILSAIETFSVGLRFPATNAGFGVREAAVDAYAAFSPLTQPGTFLLISAMFGYLMFNRRGRYPPRISIGGVLARAAKDALPVTTSVSALLLMSGVMSHWGETAVLALGLSAVAVSTPYLASANFIGIVGSLTRSSNTASNVTSPPTNTSVIPGPKHPISSLSIQPTKCRD